MQRIIAQLEQLGVTDVAVRRRHRFDDAEVEDVVPNGMAHAVFEADIDAVAALLLRGIKATSLDRGERPLLLALLRNDVPDVAELLIAAGADAASVDVHGLSPLHWLAQRTSASHVIEPLARLLVGAGADVELREKLYGAAPLAWSGWHGCTGAAQALLSLGADPLATDSFEGTASHWATLNGHAATAQLLAAAVKAQPSSVPRHVSNPAAFIRALQVKHAARLEARARGDAAVGVRLFCMACEESTGADAPGPVRQQLAQLLMAHAFTLWPPASRARV